MLFRSFFVDEQGRKMSKSLGNVIDPMEICKEYGADILRLWVTYVDFKQDMHVSERIFQQVAESYRRIRNTFKFMLGNLADFEPEQDSVPFEYLYAFDQYALARLQRLVRRVTQALEEFDYHLATTELHNYCATFLSNLYLDVAKDHLYVQGKDSPRRRSAQTVLYETLKTLLALVTPILAFTSEEIWQTLPAQLKPEGHKTVQLLAWPEPKAEFEHRDLIARWEQLLLVREEVMKALDVAIRDEVIERPLEAEVHLIAGTVQYELLADLDEELRALLIVSRVTLRQSTDLEPEALGIEIGPASGAKCERCWLTDDSVGEYAEHLGLCSRCVQVVEQYSAQAES